MARLRFTSPRSTSNWCAPGTPAPSNCWLPRTATWPICLRRRHPFELTYLGFPRERRKWMRTDDVRERANAGSSGAPSGVGLPVRRVTGRARRGRLPRPERRVAVRAEPHGRPQSAEGLRVARAAGGGGRGRRTCPDARGGLPSWTSLVRSRRISVDYGPGGAYATIRDTICPPCVIG